MMHHLFFLFFLSFFLSSFFHPLLFPHGKRVGGGAVGSPVLSCPPRLRPCWGRSDELSRHTCDLYRALEQASRAARPSRTRDAGGWGSGRGPGVDTKRWWGVGLGEKATPGGRVATEGRQATEEAPSSPCTEVHAYRLCCAFGLDLAGIMPTGFGRLAGRIPARPCWPMEPFPRGAPSLARTEHAVVPVF